MKQIQDLRRQIPWDVRAWEESSVAQYFVLQAHWGGNVIPKTVRSSGSLAVCRVPCGSTLRGEKPKLWLSLGEVVPSFGTALARPFPPSPRLCTLGLLWEWQPWWSLSCLWDPSSLFWRDSTQLQPNSSTVPSCRIWEVNSLRSLPPTFSVPFSSN